MSYLFSKDDAEITNILIDHDCSPIHLPDEIATAICFSFVSKQRPFVVSDSICAYSLFSRVCNRKLVLLVDCVPYLISAGKKEVDLSELIKLF